MQLANSSSGTVSSMARFGLIAKGVVYCLIGLLAFMAAFEIGGKGSDDTDKQAIVRFVDDQPGGKILLALLAAGLVSYSIWRFVEAFKKDHHSGSGVKKTGRKARYIFSGVVYLSIAFFAIRVLFNNDDSGGGGSANEGYAAMLLSKPMGQWLLGLAALILAGIGFYQIYYGLSEKYRKHVSQLSLHSNRSKYLLRAGKVGYVSRGLVWLIVSFLMFKAALHSNAKEAGDTAKAFDFLERASYGSYLLGALGLGLLLYGAFNFVRAKYERF